MRKLCDKKGFTIIEVMVTLAVLGIVIGPLMTMFITSQKINNEGSKEYQSIQLAQKYMEEIKGMEVFDYNTQGYVRTEVAGDYIYTKTIPGSSTDYGVVIEIKAVKEDAAVAEASIDFDSTITIDTTSVEYLVKNEAVTNHYNAVGDIDMEIKDTGVIIQSGIEIPAPLSSRKIRVDLSRNAIINISNNLDEEVELYVYNVGGGSAYTCSVVVDKGEVHKIINNSVSPVVKTADNILYNIEITVKKGAEPINTINGTTIFKYIPLP